MSDAVIAVIISSVVTIFGMFWSSKTTRDKVTQSLDKKQSLTDSKISYIESNVAEIKESMKEMKADIKSHNNYGQMFSENIPLIKERLKFADEKIGDLGTRVTKLEDNR